MSETNSQRIAIVTGAASGIGRAIAEDLRDRGMTVGALDVGADVPDGCAPLIADVRDGEQVRAAIDAFAKQHGRLDLLVGNAGVSLVGTIEDNDEADWQRTFDVNVFGQFRVVRAALPWLRESDAASIVLMSSCSATNGIPQRAVYSASKGAVQSLTAALAVDLLPENIRVNAVSPATVDTPFMAELIARVDDPAAHRRSLEARQPTGRMITPTEIATAVAYLADPNNRNVTGTTLIIDGGMATLRPV
ncbi:MAG: SDR family oxidoreductase [Planctomycetota bacterium]